MLQIYKVELWYFVYELIQHLAIRGLKIFSPKTWPKLSPDRREPPKPMVFISDGWSFYFAHIWSISGISICWKHLVKTKESSNSKKYMEKTCFKSYVRNMSWATIWYKYLAKTSPCWRKDRGITVWCLPTRDFSMAFENVGESIVLVLQDSGGSCYYLRIRIVFWRSSDPGPKSV